MQAQPITTRDLADIHGWERDRQTMHSPEGWLPPTGFWVPGILAAWMYRTDSKVALIDGVIANPSTQPEERRAAMHAVSEAIAAKAKEEGFRWLKGLTRYETVASNGRDAGYRVSEPNYMTMLLVLQ